MKNRSILFNAFVNCIKVLVEMKNGSILLFFKKANLKGATGFDTSNLAVKLENQI